MKEKTSHLLTNVYSHVVVIRDTIVIADADVAFLYNVETKKINEAVRNNRDKFPISYMFEISSDEVKELRSKNSTTKISSKSRRPTKVELNFVIGKIKHTVKRIKRNGCNDI